MVQFCQYIHFINVILPAVGAEQILKQAQALMAQLEILHQQIRSASVAWSEGGMYREDLAVLEHLVLFDERTETDALKLQFSILILLFYSIYSIISPFSLSTKLLHKQH